MVNMAVLAPSLVRGRSFSVSQLDIIDEDVLNTYRSIDAGCCPVPSGFWQEMGRLDSILNVLMTDLDSSIPNEEWVFRRLAEKATPKIIVER